MVEHAAVTLRYAKKKPRGHRFKPGLGRFTLRSEPQPKSSEPHVRSRKTAFDIGYEVADHTQHTFVVSFSNKDNKPVSLEYYNGNT